MFTGSGDDVATVPTEEWSEEEKKAATATERRCGIALIPGRFDE